ncbi:hypothetical protein [Lysobacter sp. A289]
MSTVNARLQHARGIARRRAMGAAVLATLPWLLAAIVLAWHVDASVWSQLLVAATLIASLWHVWRSGRGFDDHWLARLLDAQRADMEDSAALLLPQAAPTSALGRLQRERLRQRIQDQPIPDLRAPWKTRQLLGGAVLAGACITAIVLYPGLPQATPHPAAPSVKRAATPPTARLLDQHIGIRPPAYTGLPVRTVDTLAAKVPEGSTLQWTLHFAPVPEQVELVFHDGRRLALERDGDDWKGTLRIDKPTLYRIETDQPMPPAHAGPHRLDVVNDNPPQLHALEPQQTLTLATPGQRTWTLEFEASDDYGLSPDARLQLTRTEGGGENITARHHVITVHGRGDARHKRYRHQIDLTTLGLAAGNDVIAKLSVSDRRSPKPHTTESPSYILRWPADSIPSSSDLEGAVKRVMPAYFRSQRQIIIDAEALLEQVHGLAPDVYLEKSNTIGVDQRLLRLRYGQFLGEETSGEPRLMVTADAQDEYLATLEGDDTDASAAAGHDEHGDEHGDAPDVSRPATFGEEQDMVEQFGHTHDHAEAATLLDPTTRKLLKSALDEMWQSELNLRQGRPELALPYARRALGFIKQVQQAERIYLPRVGSEHPPIDHDRRLSGKRTGLADRGDPLEQAAGIDTTVINAWRALAPVPANQDATVDLDALGQWVESNTIDPADPLQLVAAIDALRRDPACADCREQLRRLLWPLLSRSPAATGERPSPGRKGDAYLDALGRAGEQ